jgi:hypothetical protein
MTVGFVVLSIIVMGILDLGRVYFLNLTLEDAAGEAALFLSLFPHCPEPPPATSSACANPNNAEFRAAYSGGGNLDLRDDNPLDTFEPFTYQYCAPSNDCSPTSASWTSVIPSGTVAEGTLVRVTVKVRYRILTPLIGTITRSQTIDVFSNAISAVVS